MSKTLSWIPRRNGNTHCSPACGHGCTIQDYREANKAALDLAKRLGTGWVPDVWENIGWHHAALSPGRNIRVLPTKTSGYIAFLSGEAETGETPEKAVLTIIKQSLNKLNRAAKTLSEVQSVYEALKRKEPQK